MQTLATNWRSDAAARRGAPGADPAARRSATRGSACTRVGARTTRAAGSVACPRPASAAPPAASRGAGFRRQQAGTVPIDAAARPHRRGPGRRRRAAARRPAPRFEGRAARGGRRRRPDLQPQARRPLSRTHSTARGIPSVVSGGEQRAAHPGRRGVAAPCSRRWSSPSAPGGCASVALTSVLRLLPAAARRRRRRPDRHAGRAGAALARPVPQPRGRGRARVAIVRRPGGAGALSPRRRAAAHRPEPPRPGAARGGAQRAPRPHRRCWTGCGTSAGSRPRATNAPVASTPTPRRCSSSPSTAARDCSTPSSTCPSSSTAGRGNDDRAPLFHDGGRAHPRRRAAGPVRRRGSRGARRRARSCGSPTSR